MAPTLSTNKSMHSCGVHKFPKCKFSEKINRANPKRLHSPKQHSYLIFCIHAEKSLSQSTKLPIQRPYLPSKKLRAERSCGIHVERWIHKLLQMMPGNQFMLHRRPREWDYCLSMEHHLIFETHFWSGISESGITSPPKRNDLTFCPLCGNQIVRQVSLAKSGT